MSGVERLVSKTATVVPFPAAKTTALEIVTASTFVAAHRGTFSTHGDGERKMTFQYGNLFALQFPRQVNARGACVPHCNSLMNRRLQGVPTLVRSREFCPGIGFASENDAMCNIAQDTRHERRNA